MFKREYRKIQNSKNKIFSIALPKSEYYFAMFIFCSFLLQHEGYLASEQAKEK